MYDNMRSKNKIEYENWYPNRKQHLQSIIKDKNKIEQHNTSSKIENLSSQQ